MPKRRVGLYIGLNSVGAVVIEKKEPVYLSTTSLSTLEDKRKVETIDENVRMEALINKTLRDIKAEEKEIYVSLSDKDFLLRPIEMPFMKKKEIDASLIYEIEKYIPFKVNDLVWDYDFIASQGKKNIQVSFLGIKESDFDKIKELLSGLGLTPISIEPSFLSLVRILKSLKEFSNLKNFAILDFTEDESFLTFFYQDLPIFSQYFAIPKKEGMLAIEPFAEAVRFSFQYYQREFSSYQLDKFIVIGNRQENNLLITLQQEIPINTEMVIAPELAKNPAATVENVKALGVAIAESLPYRFKPVLKKKEKPTISVEESYPIEEKGIAEEFPSLNLPILGGLVVLGILVSIFNFGYFNQKIVSEKFILSKQKEQLFIPKILEEKTSQEILELVKNKEEQLDALDKKIKTFKGISQVLERIAILVPDGMWWDRSEVILREDDKYIVNIVGNVYLANSDKERAVIYSFITKLNNDKIIKELFSKVSLISVEERQIKNFSVTSFYLKIE